MFDPFVIISNSGHTHIENKRPALWNGSKFILDRGSCARFNANKVFGMDRGQLTPFSR